MLTHTTLMLDASVSGDALASVVRALQRVPGVLLAEVNSTGSRAIVAHDAAVQPASLVAAAAGAGIAAHVVAERSTAITAGGEPRQVRSARTQQLVIVAAAAFIALALIDVLVPESAVKHWLQILCITAIWIFFFARAMVGRRP